MLIDNEPRQSVNAGQCPVSTAGRDFDPFVDPYLADPYAFWARARPAEPVFYSPELDYWVVTRYEDIKAIFADPKTFSASIAQTPIKPLASQVVRNAAERGVPTEAGDVERRPARAHPHPQIHLAGVHAQAHRPARTRSTASW